MTSEHDRIEVLSDARLFATAAPLLLPIIERRKKEALGRLMQAHKTGQTNTATIVAEISAFNDIETEIKQKESMYRTLEERQHGNNRK